MEIDFMDHTLKNTTNIVGCDTKYRMGNLLATLVETVNPDMLIGHELLGVHLSSILEFLNDEHQLKLAKINTIDIKRSLRVAVKYRIKSIFTGRLLCDTFGLSKENLRIDDYG